MWFIIFLVLAFLDVDFIAVSVPAKDSNGYSVKWIIGAPEVDVEVIEASVGR